MSTRKKARQQQPQQLPQPSDYETDAPTMENHPPPPQRSNEEVNLSVVRRYNPSITSILSHAPYATVYSFSHSAEEWTKTGVEGTIFVCALTPSAIGAAKFSVLVLNRRGLDNFELEIPASDSVQFEEPYIMLQDEDVGSDGLPLVHGLYVFHEDNTSTAQIHLVMAGIIQKCAAEADESRRLVEENANNGHDGAAEQEPVLDQEDDGSVPMGRQLSLRELFGKQREQDAEWSLKAHQSPATAQGEFPPVQAIPQPQQQQHKPIKTAFDMDPETEFFMSGRTFTPQTVVQQHARLRQNQAM